jgi:phosphoenolpyruvate carboxykinase (ATP)
MISVPDAGLAGARGNLCGSKKVTIPCSSAIVQAIVEDTISWISDPNFGYEIAESVPGVDDIEILQPRRLYDRQDRSAEYDAIVHRISWSAESILPRS